jgi:hypothetical protein
MGIVSRFRILLALSAASMTTNTTSKKRRWRWIAWCTRVRISMIDLSAQSVEFQTHHPWRQGTDGLRLMQSDVFLCGNQSLHHARSSWIRIPSDNIIDDCSADMCRD